MIQLGLSRVRRLLDPKSISWKAVHVAGTNGKGSVCAYTAALLAKAGWRVGRFTSPHLIDRWDCIQINGRTIDQGIFEDIERHLSAKNRKQDIGATEFELLTAAAFQAFNQEEIDVGVVEVGVGGREDATNILPADKVLATVITKIGLDHESLLGGTLTEVASHKAGIMKSGVPCFYDSSNGSEVIEIILKEKELLDASGSSELPLEGIAALDPRDTLKHASSAMTQTIKFLPPAHQLTAMSLALQAARTANGSLSSASKTGHTLPSEAAMLDTMQSYAWPGRLQMLSIEPLSGSRDQVLLDGAHNLDSATVLAEFVDERLRGPSKRPITWLYASSHGKDIDGIAGAIFRDGDIVVTTEFGPVDGMPWVRAEKAEELLTRIRKNAALRSKSTAVVGVETAAQRASGLAASGPMVIAGSLYLVSDILRVLRDKEKTLGSAG